jgi:hypothetical protein
MPSLKSTCLAIMATVTLAAPAFSDDADLASHLDGRWQSDWPRTKKHIDADCKTNAESLRLMERLMGKMTIQYEGNRALVTMPEIRYTTDGKERVIEGWTSEENMTVLGRTKTQIALRERSGDKDYLHLLTFEDRDTYWVYLGYSPWAGFHVREYFRRLPSK